MLRSRALAAATLALVCLQLGTLPLLAKPTRSLARPTVGKLIVAQPSSSRLSHERPAQRLASTRANTRVGSRAAAAAPRDSRIAANSPRHSGPTAPRGTTRHAPIQSANSDVDRVHAWIRNRTLDEPSAPSHSRAGMRQQRALAAQAATAVADRTPRSSRAERRLARQRAVAAAGIALAQLSRTSVSRTPADGRSTGDEPLATVSEAPTNIASVLGPQSDRSRLRSIQDEAASPVLLPGLRVGSLYDNRGRLIVPPPLYGSHENLLRQNQMADRDGLDRVRNDADLMELRRQLKLVAIPENDTLRVDARLPENRRYSRPWTAAFLAILARDHYANFHQPLQVDSAVRTVQFQQRLTHTNGNAAPSTGDTASPHLTGQAIDIAKHGLSITEIAWMRAYLQPLIGAGKIDVEEEFQQACFHISVYKNFVPDTTSRFTLAATR